MQVGFSRKAETRPRSRASPIRRTIVPKSILEAIKMGLWDYEPPQVSHGEFDGTNAMPGTDEKVEVLAERVRTGLPLWHPRDRDDVESPRVGKPR
jgi:hypothetical protein